MITSHGSFSAGTRRRRPINKRMTNPRAMRVAALMGLLAVALGAFGAHALKEVLARTPMAAGLWDKAVFYHFIHAVMLFFLATRKPVPRVPWFGFLFGIILFSGSLYLYAGALVGGAHAVWRR
jgi:uncharacterized membrane protein YgdD (TMEM256/DUF423 family)